MPLLPLPHPELNVPFGVSFPHPNKWGNKNPTLWDCGEDQELMFKAHSTSPAERGAMAAVLLQSLVPRCSIQLRNLRNPSEAVQLSDTKLPSQDKTKS